MSGSLNLKGERLKYALQTRIGTAPALFFPIVRTRRIWVHDTHWLRPSLTGPDTDLVIEGYPRSGNTFAVVAFQTCQPQLLRVAHHHHAPAQVMRAVKLKIPVLVLIRTPADAVTSLLVRRPELTPELALRSYVRFYRSLLRLTPKLVVARFDELTADFGAVIEKLNERTGHRFAHFTHNSSTVQACFRVIDERNRERNGTGVLSEEAVARPSTERSKRQRAIRETLLDPPRRPLLEVAEEVYARFVDERPES